MIDAQRTLRRPAPGFSWRALALYVGPALLLAATVLPTVLLLGRLPRHLAPPHQRLPTDFLFGAGFSGGLVVAGWACLLAFSWRARRSDRRMFWELWVPLLYGVGGYLAVFGGRDVLLNLDRPYTPPAEPGPLELLAAFAAVLACAGVGLLLGRRAAATEPAPRAGVRAVWISDVDADRWWWLMQGIVTAATCLLLAIPFVLAGSWAAALQTDAALLAACGVLAAWASRGHVSISPWGIRVHYGHVPLLGWQLPIDQIAAVEVGRVRLLRSTAAWRCLSHLALRDGPALIVCTRAGGRRVVTLPRAEDAAVTVRTWMARRQAPA